MDETVIGALDQAEGARLAAEASGGRVYDGLDGPKLTSVDPETLTELRAASGVGGAGWLAPHRLPVGEGHVHIFVEQVCDCGAWLNPQTGVVFNNLRPISWPAGSWPPANQFVDCKAAVGPPEWSCSHCKIMERSPPPDRCPECGGGVYVERGTQVAPTFPPECYGTGCDEFPGVRS
jgi:hypothetical protein